MSKDKKKDKKHNKKSRKHESDSELESEVEEERVDDDNKEEEENEEEAGRQAKSNFKNRNKIKDTSPTKAASYDNPYSDQNYGGKRFDIFLMEESKKLITDESNDEEEDDGLFNNGDSSQISSQYNNNNNNKRRNKNNTKLDIEKLYKIIESNENKTICEFIKDRIFERIPIFEYVQIIFKAITAESSIKTQSDIRGEMIECFLYELIIYDRSTIDEKQLNQIIDLLLSECDGLSRHSYREISTKIAENISRNRKPATLLLLPKAIEQLSFLDSTDKESDEAFKNSIIREFCTSTWDKSIFTAIVSMLNDLTLTKSELESLVTKILDDGKKLNIDELPSLIYNVILFTRQGLKGKILFEVCNFFSKLDEEDENENGNRNRQSLLGSELSFIESIVLNQISISIKQDFELGKDYLKFHQNASPFVIGLLMTMAKIPKYQSIAFDSLKSISIQKAKVSSDQVAELFRITVYKNWEHIIDPFINFAITLMETNSLVINEQIKTLRGVGEYILYELYSRYEQTRDKIIDEIVGRIIMKSNSLPPNWFNLLGRIANDNPLSLRKYHTKLKEMFDYLQHYTTNTVKQLIGSLKTLLLNDNASFLNSIIIVLKKSMFAREVEARISAVTGFLELLKRVSEMTYLSAFTDDKKKMKTFISEIFSNLRRALTQQCTIRSILYQGFIELIGFNSDDFAVPIFELLTIQSNNVFDLNLAKSNSPINIPECTEIRDQVHTIVEPVDKLIYCIQYCLNSFNGKYIDPRKDQLIKEKQRLKRQQLSTSQAASGPSQNISSQFGKSVVSTALTPQELSDIYQQLDEETSELLNNRPHQIVSLEKIFIKFGLLMNECSLETFGLPQHADGSSKTSVTSQLIIGSIEALIEHNSLELIPSLDKILSLFTTHSTLKSLFLENKSKTSSANKGGGGASKGKGKGGKGKKKASDEDEEEEENEEISSDNEGSSDSEEAASSKKKSSSSKSPPSRKSSTNVNNFEFPSQKCTINILKLIYDGANSVQFRKSDQGKQFLLYIYSTLSSVLNKVSSSFKVSKKTLDISQFDKVLQDTLSYFKDIVPFIYQEFAYPDWVEPPKSDKKNEAKKQMIHSLALNCFHAIVQCVKENGTAEANMYNMFHNTIDEIRKREHSRVLQIYQKQLNEYEQRIQHIRKKAAGDKLGDSDEEMDNIENEEDIEVPVQPPKDFPRDRGIRAIQTMCKYIESIIVKHLFPEFYGDIESLFNILSILYSSDSIDVQPCFLFLKQVSSKHEIESPTLSNTILKSIIDMCNKKNSPISETLSKYVLALLDSYKPDFVVPSKKLAIINSKTVSSTIQLLLINEESFIDRSKDTIALFKKNWNSNNKLNNSSNRDSNNEDQVEFNRQRNDLASTLNNTCQVLNNLAVTQITGSPHEKFLKLIKKLYIILSSYITFLSTLPSFLTPQIADLITQSSLLYSNVFGFFEWTDKSQQSSSKKLSKPDKQRLAREAKSQPQIIHALEKYESNVIKLQKKWNIRQPLGKHFKEVQSREFVVDTATLNQIFEGGGNNDGSDEDEDRPAGRKVSKPTKTTSKKSAASKRKTHRDDDDDDNDEQDSPSKKRKSVNISTAAKKKTIKSKK